MPEQLENLIDIARIKYLSKELHIEKIASRRNAVLFTFNPNTVKDVVDIPEIVKEYGNRIKFSSGIKPMVTFTIKDTSDRNLLREVTEFVKFLNKK